LQPANSSLIGERCSGAQHRCSAGSQSSVVIGKVNSQLSCRFQQCSEAVTFVAVATAVAGAPMLSITDDLSRYMHIRIKE